MERIGRGTGHCAGQVHFRVAKTMKSELVIFRLGQTVSFLYG